jgi:hypothetical protein
VTDVYVIAGALVYLVVVAVLSRHRLGELLPQRFFVETWLEADQRAAAARARQAEAGNASVDWRPLITFVVVALVLTGQKYLGDPAIFQGLLHHPPPVVLPPGVHAIGQTPPTASGPFGWLTDPHWIVLVNITYWDATQVIGFLVVPAIVVWMRRERLRDYGMRAEGFLHHAWIYAFLAGLVIPVVWLASGTPGFLSYYPIYKLAGRSLFDFGFWECVYALQFLAVEFFFRGFMVLGLGGRLGSASIAAAVAPYCMIHFGKPPAEVCAAVLAGIVLGTLAIKTRSILAGALIHVTVAISMDVSALLRTTGLPRH